MGVMNVMLLSPLQHNTGNNTSSHRIRDYLLEDGYHVDLQNSNQFDRLSHFHEYLQQFKPDCILAVHAFRSGTLLLECPLPFALIFGGTDVNEHYKERNMMSVMSQVVHKAKFLVAFSRPMFNQAIHIWPDVHARLIEQPQAVVTSPDCKFQFLHHLQEVSDIGPDSVIFLLLTGLRPVKDVLFLPQVFSEWHQENTSVHLVIAGPELDETYTKEVKRVVSSLVGVHLLPRLSLSQAHAAIRDSFALVNSSLSEGMASTILEAMSLEVPVVARSIPGNIAIISHEETGLLFNTSQDFVIEAKRLLQDRNLKNSITKAAKRYLTSRHSVDQEKATYCKIVRDLLNADMNA